MQKKRWLQVGAPLALLLGACGGQTVVTPDRVEPTGTVVVSPDYTFADWRCTEGEPVQVFLDGDPVGGGVAGEDGAFEIEVTAPGTPEDYGVWVECVPDDFAAFGNGLSSASLIVEPVLTMAADPDVLGPGESFDVTGNFCVSDSDESVPPFVTVEFEGETQQAVATQGQPFDETWTVPFDAPEEEGTYDVDAECVYDEWDPDDFGPLAAPSGDEVGVAAPSEPQPYPTVQVTVVVDEEPEPTTTTTTTTTEAPGTTTTTTAAEVPRAPEPAPAAQPVTAVPTFTA